MIINNHEFHFAYTVGAFCTIAEMDLPIPQGLADQCKVITRMAVVMSKAYEDKKRVEDPAYKVRYLTREEVSALSIDEVITQLSPEINEAVTEGTRRTVEAEPGKN